MLDAYSSIGMPLMYRHWSFGKRFAQDEAYYKKGLRSLAYETGHQFRSLHQLRHGRELHDHAGAGASRTPPIGHNHFFKNNYQFRSWTQPDPIIDYLELRQELRRRMRGASRRTTPSRRVLDAAHALMNQGVSRDFASAPRNVASARAESATRAAGRMRRQTYDDLWRTLPEIEREGPSRRATWRAATEQRPLGLPEENLLYFLEKHAPKLEGLAARAAAHRAHASQYFYPQRQTKMMNEGCATFVHYAIMNRLHETRPDRPTARCWNSCTPFVRGLPARLQRSPLLRHQSLRARLCHDARHRAHLRPSRPRRTATGFPTSPAMATRWARCAGLGRLPRRELHACNSSRRK